MTLSAGGSANVFQLSCKDVLILHVFYIALKTGSYKPFFFFKKMLWMSIVSTIYAQVSTIRLAQYEDFGGRGQMKELIVICLGRLYSHKIGHKQSY